MAYTRAMQPQRREELLSEVVETIAEGVYFIDLDGRIGFWNKGAERITGYLRSETLGKRCSESLLRHVDATGCELCVNGCPLASVIAEGAPREVEAYLHHKDGHRIPVAVRATPIMGPDGRPSGAIEVFSDRSERSMLIAELETLKQEVLKDALTGLGNRRYAELSADSALRDSDAEGLGAGVLMIDIDHFKEVNDGYGHASGDRVLRMVGWTLANAVRRNDAAVRWGGEEFLVVCPRIGGASLAEVAERVRALVERSWLRLEDGRRISVTVSIGAAMSRRGDSLTGLAARADEMLYASKAAGRNRVTIAE
jgi:diguanylate cyclase (GGDEF)-like protein/PAS domain S-box-containing protein